MNLFSRSSLLAGAGLLALAVTPDNTAPVDASWGSSGAERTCTSQVLVLPALTPTGRAWVGALNDSGLVVGEAWEDGQPADVVVWTDPAHVLATGVGGVIEDGHRVSAEAVEVNESGQVAITRTTYGARRTFSVEAVVWSATDGALVLPAPAARPRAYPTAINDAGDVVGVVYGRGNGRVPVLWRDGQRSRLPVPARLTAYPADINNAGLVVGGFSARDNWEVYGAWFWDLTSGEHGRLRPPDTDRRPQATLVDNAGRVLGSHGVGAGDARRTLMWRDRAALPRPLLRLEVLDVHDGGYLAAIEPGFRGFGGTAYVGHRRDGGVSARLPEPPDAGGTIDWNNVVAEAVGRGVSAFAPQGGVTVGGHAQDDDFTNQAVLWTCAQTLL